MSVTTVSEFSSTFRSMLFFVFFSSQPFGSTAATIGPPYKPTTTARLLTFGAPYVFTPTTITIVPHYMYKPTTTSRLPTLGAPYLFIPSTITATARLATFKAPYVFTPTTITVGAPYKPTTTAKLPTPTERLLTSIFTFGAPYRLPTTATTVGTSYKHTTSITTIQKWPTTTPAWTPATTCNPNCVNQKCHFLTRTCIDCPPGKTGSYCHQVCERGKYGQGCSKECSQFCNTVNETGDNESPCHHVTGTCIYGCIQGYEGSSCESEKKISSSPSSSSPGLGVGLGIGLGVAALIVIIGVAIYCYRRRSRTQRSRRQRPAGYDPPEPTTDEHKYSDLFKSADDYTLPTDMVSSSDSPTSPPENIPQDTVQYVNADVGHYEEIGHVTFNGESEGHYQLEIGRHGRGGKNNAGYANM